MDRTSIEYYSLVVGYWMHWQFSVTSMRAKRKYWYYCLLGAKKVFRWSKEAESRAKLNKARKK